MNYATAPGEKALGAILDFIYANIIGDDNPNSAQNCYDMQTAYIINIFNPNTPNVPGVYYQSWTGKIRYISPLNIWAAVLWPLIGAREGDNDGCVSVTSGKWGVFKGVLSGAWWCDGVDHIKVINHPFGITPGFDAKGFYVGIVEELKDKGF